MGLAVLRLFAVLVRWFSVGVDVDVVAARIFKHIYVYMHAFR